MRGRKRLRKKLAKRRQPSFDVLFHMHYDGRITRVDSQSGAERLVAEDGLSLHAALIKRMEDEVYKVIWPRSAQQRS